MGTYTMMEELLASPVDPLPIEKRMFQLEIMWQGLENLQKSPKPTQDDWGVVADAINMMEALRDLGVVEDPDKALDEAKEAMGKAGIRSLGGENIRLNGPAINLICGILQDYCDALEALPARTMIKAHRYAEKRFDEIVKGKKRTGDVSVK